MIASRFAVGAFVAAGLCANSLAMATFLPPNDLHLAPSPYEKSNISRAQFNDIITKINNIYAPVVAAHGAKLVFFRLWKDETVNASASQNGTNWEVRMYGGLARRPEVTPDGFALVVCHELGHHLGGYAFYNDISGWAANEGQSDYFATQSCAREIWRNDIAENAKHRSLVNPVAKRACEVNYSQIADQNLCFRTADAGLSLASVLAVMNKSQEPPKFETPSKSEVEYTKDAHPEAQCRLDTYLAGATCPVQFDSLLIPGKDLPDHYGQEAERAAAKVSCMASDGWVISQRPRCWFKPHFVFEGAIALSEKWQDASGNAHAEPGEVLQLTVPLINRWTKENEVVTGELFSSTEGIVVAKSKVTYPNLKPNAPEISSEPFEVRVSPSFQCGQPFELTFRANSKYGSREFPIHWFVGPAQAGTVVLGVGDTAINVGDFPAPAVEVAMESASAAEATHLELDVQVVGYYPEEVEFALTTPEGKNILIGKGANFDPFGNARMKIFLGKPTALRGVWKLSFRDTQAVGLETIARFALRAPLAEKVACGSTLKTTN